MQLMELCEGTLRLPLTALEAGKLEALKREMRALKLIQ